MVLYFKMGVMLAGERVSGHFVRYCPARRLDLTLDLTSLPLADVYLNAKKGRERNATEVRGE
jgi:hypothetical protein